jgi:hypothetical protein
MTTTNRIALATSLFEDSLVHHLDNTKPDPLAKQQVEEYPCLSPALEALVKDDRESFYRRLFFSESSHDASI